MRRVIFSIVVVVAVAALSGAGFAATNSASRTSCAITPKHAWTSCPHANLAGKNLVRADLRNANLAGANLTDAKLTQANLAAANLSRARLTRARLDDSNLGFANLAGASSVDANLSRKVHEGP